MNRKIKIFVISALIAVLSLNGPLAFAKGGPKGGTSSGFGHGEKKGWNGESTPPGWTHGKKKGWDENEVPPGLSEKENKIGDKAKGKNR